VAAIYLAAREEKCKLPECEWWEVFDVEREELGFLVLGMKSLEGGVKDVGNGIITLDEAKIKVLLLEGST